MTTRHVRGESGAIFDVDPSMLDTRVDRAVDYRASSAPPRASEITPAPRSAHWGGLVAPAVLALLWIAMALIYASMRS